MIKIYIGICKTRDDERFWKSFHELKSQLSDKYSIIMSIVKDTYLPDAQNWLAKQMLDAGSDYLLLLDDDQWGHTIDMVDTLVEADAYVATIKTYCRKYPYMCAAWNKVGKSKALVPIEYGFGYIECDLTGFPMTLIHKDTFKILEQPYFRPLEAEGRTWNSDVDFFERLAEKKIKPIVCFQHTLNHDKVTQENVYKLREAERNEHNNEAWFNILKSLEKGA